jgi:hypothetical protein
MVRARILAWRGRHQSEPSPQDVTANSNPDDHEDGYAEHDELYRHGVVIIIVCRAALRCMRVRRGFARGTGRVR